MFLFCFYWGWGQAQNLPYKVLSLKNAETSGCILESFLNSPKVFYF